MNRLIAATASILFLAVLIIAADSCGKASRSAHFSGPIPIVTVADEGAQLEFALTGDSVRPKWVALSLQDTPCANITSLEYDAAGKLITLTASADAPAFLLGYAALPDGSGLAEGSFNPNPDIQLVLESRPGVVAVGAYLPAGETCLTLKLGKETASKAARSIPKDSANSVVLDVSDMGGPHLTWNELNIGDCDMNGMVGIADLTPLAMFYNDTSSGTWDEWHDAVDGNLDGSISIADITPIAMHFGNKVTGYRIMRHADGVGDWVQQMVAARPYDPSASGQPKVRPPYVWDDATPIGNAFYAVQPADGAGSFGIPSNVGAFGSPVNPAPSGPGIVDNSTPPDELDLALGEVSMLPNITIESSRSLPTDAGQEYLVVLTSGSPVTEGADPEAHFNVLVSYEDAGTSSVSCLVPMGNRMWYPPEPTYGADRSRQEREIVMNAGRNTGMAAVKHASANVNDIHDFNIVFADDDMNTLDGTITARCASTGARAELWIDDREDDGRVTPANLADLQTWLDSRVVDMEIAAYGQMMNPAGETKLTVIFTEEINKLPGLIGGMFVANDLQPTAIGGNSKNSIYVEVPDPTGVFEAAGPVSNEDFLDQLVSVPTHELQHLINFSNRLRAYQSYGTFYTEESWVNEGLSHFTEDYCGFQPENNFVSPDHYLATTPWVELPGGNTSNPSIFRRGASYLFTRYLDDRFGDTLLADLAQTGQMGEALVGRENVETATGADLTDLLLSDGLAMYASGLGLSTAASYRYAPVSIDAVTGAQHGVHFRSHNESFSAQEYQVGEPLAYLLSPGYVSSRNYTVRKNALCFIRLVPGTHNFGKLTITTQGGDNVQAALMRIDTGELLTEAAAVNVGDTCLVMGNISAPGEEDSYTVNIPQARDYIFRVVSLTDVIGEFTFSINGSSKPNHAFDPDNPAVGPPGVYQLHTSFITSGTYTLGISTADGTSTGEYYLLVLPYY